MDKSSADFDLDQGASRDTGAIKGGTNTGRRDMPFETTLTIIASILAFGGYAVLLGWGLWYTRRA